MPHTNRPWEAGGDSWSQRVRGNMSSKSFQAEFSCMIAPLLTGKRTRTVQERQSRRGGTHAPSLRVTNEPVEGGGAKWRCNSSSVVKLLVLSRLGCLQEAAAKDTQQQRRAWHASNNHHPVCISGLVNKMIFYSFQLVEAGSKGAHDGPIWTPTLKRGQALTNMSRSVHYVHQIK